MSCLNLDFSRAHSHTGVKVPKMDIPGQSDLCLVLFLKKVEDSSPNKCLWLALNSLHNRQFPK